MPAPPTGTVTFLFTDIQGSTKLWEQEPDAMRPALARHDRLLRAAIETSGGYIFKTVGDAFCAAFSTAPQALQAALAAQMALDTVPWETAAPLRVRMALHTGSAEERGGDYFGPPLNRVARLMAAGHGGQTLLSLAVQELTRDTLPASVSLQGLGPHRLKDLGRSETVFQLLHPSLPAEFPPLNSLDNPALPNNLPQQVTSFIGREKQVAEVKALLSKGRLLTLTGAGGSGKTRLSLQVAADLLTGDGDGVWLVEMAGLSDPVLVPQVVADVLGIQEAAGRPIQQTLLAALKEKRLLLILDNCEHLVSACASLAADLLRFCPEVHLLASSREALNVAGEQTYRVPTLTLPDPKTLQTAEALSQFEAVRLFIDRAQAVQSSFSVTDANAPAVAQVCFRLDGIPLALELAAARVRSLPVEEINRRLDSRFRLLTGGARNTLPRQQTLRALIDWSYDLLTDQEKTLLCRLSVFAGGWTVSAAEEVCAGQVIEDWELLDLLTALTDKSLTVYEVGTDGESRYRLLETVRQYAAERLTEAGEADSIHGSHFAWCLALAEEAEPQMTGPEQGAWFSRLEAEHDNLRAGLTWNEQRADGAEEGLRLVASLWRFWSVRGHLSEGRRRLDLALIRAGEASAARAKALNGAGILAWIQNDFARARAFCEESLTLQRQLGDRLGIASALNILGLVAMNQGDHTEARALFEESLAVYRQTGNQQGIANALSNLGMMTNNQGDYAAARVLGEETLAIQRRLGNQRGIAEALGNLGAVAWTQKDYTRARVLFVETLAIQQRLGNQQGIAHALGNLGLVAHRQSQLERAVRLNGAAAFLRETIGSPLDAASQKEMDTTLASAGKALGEEAFTVIWNAGQAMTQDQAVEYALADD